jgi:hypothetical protein
MLKEEINQEKKNKKPMEHPNYKKKECSKNIPDKLN